MPLIKTHLTEQILLDDIYPNPWNPNMTSARVDDAIRESIMQYGFVQPLICRPHPTEAGKYQVIDGEHRLEAALDIGMDSAPVVVLDLDEIEAKRLTIIANETRGRAEIVPLAELLEELTKELEEPLQGLPYYEADVADILTKAERLQLSDLKVPNYYSRAYLKVPPTGHSTFNADLKKWLQENYPEVILVS